jgi:hypothetical protein
MVGSCSSSTSDDYSSFVMHLCEFSLSLPLDFVTEVPFFLAEMVKIKLASRMVVFISCGKRETGRVED